MKILRRLLLIILLLMIVFLLIGLFLPKMLILKKEIFIKSPVDQVFMQINDLRNWPNWSPWFASDSTVKIQYSAETIGTGSYLTYQGKKLGSGKITILNSYPADSMIFELDFVDRGKASGKFILSNVDTGTNITWIMQSNLGINPFSRWFSLLLKDNVGSDFEKGLVNLSSIMEKMKIKFYQIELTKIPARILITIRDTCRTDEINTNLGSCYKRLMEYINTHKLTITGPPVCFYHHLNDSLADIEPALVVDRIIDGNSFVSFQETPQIKVVKAVYFGNYDKISEAWAVVETFIQQRQLEPAGPPWEEYITDPMIESDTTKWQTNIYYPVK